MKFQIVHAPDTGQVFIRIKGGNNEIIVSGEQQHNMSDAFNTVMRMKEDAGYAVVEEIRVDGSINTLWAPSGGVVAPSPIGDGS